MKKVTLADGTIIKLPSTLSDLDVQRVVSLLMDKLDPKEKPDKDIIVLNTPLPEMPKIPDFPKIPAPVDYSKLIREVIGAMPKGGSVDMSGVTKAINEQTKAIVGAIDMQSEVLAELVVAYREPKKITRDDEGRPEGIQ